MSDIIELEPTPDSVGRARRWSIQCLEDAGKPELSETVALLVSELISNVVLHARTRCVLRIDNDQGSVRVEVRDGNDRMPFNRAPTDPLAQSGRGMLLIDGLSDLHGAEALPEGGKLVWFEKRMPVST